MQDSYFARFQGIVGVGFLYILIIIVLAAATIVEHFMGTPATHDAIYGSWWFVGLWILLVLLGCIYFMGRFRHKALNLTNVNTILIHFSFVVILLGALVTHTTARQGIIHLRGDQPVNIYMNMDYDNMTGDRLPFYIKLDKFAINYHAGTDSPEDYVTHFSIIDGASTIHASVAMNKIYTYRHYRLYQSSYDTDNQGSYLSVGHDPWGISITYTGYALLFLSLLLLLINPKGSFRALLRNPMLQKGFMTLALLVFPFLANATVPTPDQQTADHFGRLFMQYNGRICPAQTFALDFMQKVHGSHRYNGLSAEQTLVGWIMYPQEWAGEPFIHVKSKKLRKEIHVEEYARLSDFFPGGNYILGPYIQAYGQGNHDALHKASADVDNKIEILMALRMGKPLKMIPHTVGDVTTWYCPTDTLPSTIGGDEALFAKNIFPMVFQMIAEGDNGQANSFLDKFAEYQQKNAGNSLPTPQQVKAERIYNAVSIPSILFMFNLFMGFVVLGVIFRRMRAVHLNRPTRFAFAAPLFSVLLVVSFLALTLTLVLRWIISGTVPMSNGYDTMLVMAWMVMLAMLFASWRFRGLRLMTLAFGFLLSGFFLLVSHINAMDPAIGHVMPVLNSPLLSIHVSIIMMGFSLLALTFICSVTALVERSQEKELQLFSRLLLYPAVVTLTIGIFIGAVWANISWGNYWTWDPKETWALITLMVYAVPLHTQSLPALSRPRNWHWFMALAFLTLVMTYFGVNYFLEGMHSYA